VNWTTDEWLRGLYDQTEAKRQKFRTLASGEGEKRLDAGEAAQEGRRRNRVRAEEAYRDRLRGRLREALGLFPEQDVPLQARLTETIEYEDYVLEQVTYTTMEGMAVPAAVLVPKRGQGPWPAILACHGHGHGQRDALGLDEYGREVEDAGIHNRFAVQLVRKGFVVVVPEIMGFGERRQAADLQANPSGNSCAALASSLLLYGRTLAGMRVYEAKRALDYIQSRPDVRPGGIGCFGFSGGSLIASYTAALDERIQAVVLCSWTNTFQGSILAMFHCIDNYLPGILLAAEQPELIGLIAPRALFVESGELDPIFPVAETRKAIAQLQDIYATHNAAQRFGSDIHPGGHRISGKVSVEWLVEQLRSSSSGL